MQTTRTTGDALPGRVLLILMGSMRGAPASWASIERSLQQHHADLMLVLAEPMVAALAAARATTNDSDASSFAHHLGRHALHIVSVPEYDDYATALDLIEAVRLDDGDLRRPQRLPKWRERRTSCPRWYENSRLGGVRNATCILTAPNQPKREVPIQQKGSGGSSAIVGVYRWFAKRALIERGLLKEYEWFMVTRTDIHVLCALRLPPISLLVQLSAASKSASTSGHARGAGVAIVPVGEDWGGLYDRFLVADRGAVLPGLTTLEHWLHGRMHLPPSAEMLLRRSLDRASVRVLRVPRTSFVVQSMQASSPGRRVSTAAPLRTRELPSFERVRSNWGGCMHAASHVDVGAFGMPTRWRLRSLPAPTEMLPHSLCPKYAAAWWLAKRTCSASTF